MYSEMQQKVLSTNCFHNERLMIIEMQYRELEWHGSCGIWPVNDVASRNLIGVSVSVPPGWLKVKSSSSQHDCDADRLGRQLKEGRKEGRR
mmetsp:Transcript_24944/g.36539  ORF Transcript_24944/g.36539 Transcript_24944/m.36539 type:complete len:91 (+) Transcript_24944:813-1085(+)